VLFVWAHHLSLLWGCILRFRSLLCLIKCEYENWPTGRNAYFLIKIGSVDISRSYRLFACHLRLQILLDYTTDKKQSN
jgi:hypothetical protein